MSNRTERITTYVDEDLAEEIERRASAEETTVSTYVADVLEEHLHAEATETALREADAERRVEELVAQARDEVTDAAGDVREAAVLASIYAIANWELTKSNHGDVARRQALSTGARRTKHNAPGVDPDTLDLDDESTDTTDEPDRGFDFG